MKESNKITIEKVKTALKEVILEILFKHHLSPFRTNSKNIDISYFTMIK
jgi:hypothetical protein